jgi:tryptophan-rich sensory protein
MFPLSDAIKNTLGLAAWLVLCFIPAAIGAYFNPGEWYATLNKPSWNPPGWVFGPVWTTLYAMMAVSAWLVWKKGGFAQQRLPLTVFLVQLVLNALWSPLFFGLKMPGVALVEIVALWLAIAGTIGLFWRVDRVAAGLLVPYLAWVSFATVLNGTLWWMNR